MTDERLGRRLQENVVDPDLEAFCPGVELRTHLERPLHVHLDRQVEVGNRADRLGQPPGDRLAHLARL